MKALPTHSQTDSRSLGRGDIPVHVLDRNIQRPFQKVIRYFWTAVGEAIALPLRCVEKKDLFPGLLDLRAGTADAPTATQAIIITILLIDTPLDSVRLAILVTAAPGLRSPRQLYFALPPLIGVRLDHARLFGAWGKSMGRRLPAGGCSKDQARAAAASASDSKAKSFNARRSTLPVSPFGRTGRKRIRSGVL